MSSYIFPGYPAFLESAETELDLIGSAGAAGRIVPLAALANLCAQAAQGDLAHARGILAKATEFRDHLAVALRGAELMLAEVGAARAQSRSETEVALAAPASEDTPPETRKSRKSSLNPREAS